MRFLTEHVSSRRRNQGFPKRDMDDFSLTGSEDEKYVWVFIMLCHNSKEVQMHQENTKETRCEGPEGSMSALIEDAGQRA